MSTRFSKSFLHALRQRLVAASTLLLSGCGGGAAKSEPSPRVVITERNHTGGYGSTAAAFKKRELEILTANGRTTIEWAFGNMPSDAETYAVFVRDPRHRVFYRYSDTAFGGRRIESYVELLPEVTQ